MKTCVFLQTLNLMKKMSEGVDISIDSLNPNPIWKRLFTIIFDNHPKSKTTSTLLSLINSSDNINNSGQASQVMFDMVLKGMTIDNWEDTDEGKAFLLTIGCVSDDGT